MIQSRRVPFVCVALLVSIFVAGMPVMAADSAVEGLIKVLPEDTIAFVATGGGGRDQGRL